MQRIENVSDEIQLDLSRTRSTTSIATNEFSQEYENLLKVFSTQNVASTGRQSSVDNLRQNLSAIVADRMLSKDAKILKIVELMSSEYSAILNTFGGANSKLGKWIKTLCNDNLGIVLHKGGFSIKEGSVVDNIVKSRAPEDLLPSPIIDPPVKTSKSAPVIESEKEVPKPTVSSVDSIRDREPIDKPVLRTDKNLSRLGTMFGSTQFCYGEKPGGVEPGFRAIDLDKAFFDELVKILKREELFPDLLKSIEKSTSLKHAQRIFSTFINANSSGPHAKNVLDKGIDALCEFIKEAVKTSSTLSAWMYKLDYASQGESKPRVNANNEALREFVGTRLAGIFSNENQKQEIAWVQGPTGPHAMLACGWKNGLQELSEFLVDGGEPDYQGILVEDKNNPLIKHSKVVEGLGKNLIFGLAIGDRDGIGKDAQNKGFAGGSFYGFDYGKPYEGEGVAGSLTDDFMFEDPLAWAPEVFRGSSMIGVARHYMYRNYTIFFDTPLSDRMFGVHILKKMITGENPPDDVVRSYPGLAKELGRIDGRTPTTEGLLSRLSGLRGQCRVGGEYRNMLDSLCVQVGAGKPPFERYFVEMKTDLIQEAIKNKMPYSELQGYLRFIDQMAARANTSNKQILNVFEKRLALSQDEVNFLDKLEKVVSPASIMSHKGGVILNYLRITSPEARIPFQLEKMENGGYRLTTKDKNIIKELEKRFDLEPEEQKEGLSCVLKESELRSLMAKVDEQYIEKKQQLLVKPNYLAVTLPKLVRSLNSLSPELDNNAILEFKWVDEKDLSLRITVHTKEQAEFLKGALNLAKLPPLNASWEILIPERHLTQAQKVIESRCQNLLSEREESTGLRGTVAISEMIEQPGLHEESHKDQDRGYTI